MGRQTRNKDNDESAQQAAMPDQQACDEQWFAVQFAGSFRILWLIAVGIIGDRTAADDIVQEAALVAWQKRQTYKRGTNFTAWMGQMVRYTALNHARKRQRQAASPLDDMELARPAATLDHGAVGPEPLTTEQRVMSSDQPYFDDEIVTALGSLSTMARSCLLLRTLEDLPYARIAKLLDIPEGTAMSHVHRSRQLLRKQLAERWPTVPACKGPGP